MQRQSNNFRPQFTDEECITVYLWGISQRRFEQKAIYDYTQNHLLEWFPKLPSYQAFSERLNRLAPAFQALAEYWLSVIGVDLGEQLDYIVVSCPPDCKAAGAHCPALAEPQRPPFRARQGCLGIMREKL